jgi:DNA-binding CsgD family transcriptional regulator
MTEKEWKLFNDFLLEIYYIDDIKQFGDKCMKLIKLFIPYEQGHFIVIDNEGNVDAGNSVFVNMDKVMQKEFIEKYYQKDYLNYLYPFSKTMSFRDTDLMNDEKRRNSEMYLKFIRPQRLDMGCGLIVMKDGKVLAQMNMLRKAGSPDVSDHEIEILNTFKEHFEKNIFHYKSKKVQKYIDIKGSKDVFHLSNREREIVELVAEGCSNIEIGDRLNIASSTVKKHISNIFDKTGVNKRIQLIKLLEKKVR